MAARRDKRHLKSGRRSAAQLRIRGYTDQLSSPSGNRRRALQRLREHEPLSVISAVLHELEKEPKARRLLAGVPFARTLQSLGTSLSFARQDSLLRELRWQAATLSNYTDELRDFVRKKREFDHALLLDDVSTAKAVHAEICQSLGHSCWSVETGLLIAERDGGLEANRKFMKDVQDSAQDQVLQLFAYFWSQRAEAELSPGAYIHSVNQFLRHQSESPKSTPGGLMYLALKLKGWEPEAGESHIGPLTTAIWMENRFPIVDRYLMVLRIIQLLAAWYDTTALPSAPPKDVLQALSPVDDARISNIERLLGYIDEDEQRNDGVVGALWNSIDLFTEGKYDDCKAIVREQLKAQPNALEWYELYAKCCLHTNSPLDSPFSERAPASLLLNGLYQLLAKGDKAMDGYADVIRFVMTFDSFQVSQQAFALALRHTIPGQKRMLTLNALNEAVLTPRVALLRPEFTDATAYLESFNASISQGATLGFHREFTSAFLDQRPLDSTLKLPESRRDEYNARLLELRGQFRAAASAYRTLYDGQAAQPLNAQSALEGLFRCLLKSEGIDALRECVEVVAATYFRRQHLLGPLPLADLLSRYRAQKPKGDLTNTPAWALAQFVHYEERQKPLQTRQLYYLVDDFLRSVGLKKPSELGQVADRYPAEQLGMLLRKVCIPDVLDNSVRFSGTVELEDERIAVCELAAKLDPKRATEDAQEIAKIRQDREVREAVRHVEESKVFVNVDGILRSLDKSFREKFERYVRISTLSDKRLREALVLKGYAVEHYDRVISFEDDGYRLFRELFNEIRDKFISGGGYGLDSYLSLRIRHGTLLGHIRSQFETFHLLTAKDKSGRYGPNEHWLTKMGPDAEPRIRIDARLQEFSKQVDALSEEVRTKWIQIRKPELREGLFDFVFSDVETKELYANVADLTEFAEFFQNCVQSLWQRTEENLAVVRHKLTRTLRDQFLTLLDGLAADVSKPSDVAPSGLLPSITQCRTYVQHELERLAAWFSVADKKTMPDFSLDHLLRTCGEILKRCFPLKSLFVAVDSQLAGDFVGPMFTHMVDLFYMPLENIVRHSGLPAPTATVIARLTDGTLTFHITNPLGEGADRDHAAAKIREFESTEELAEDGTRSSTEGGSGFFKMRRLLRNDLHRTSCEVLLKLEPNSFAITLSMNGDGMLR